MKKWIKENLPLTQSFLEDLLKSLNNKREGYSLRKLLAVGFFWLIVILCLRYTDSDNLSIVVGILSGMITSLIITYSVTNIQQMKINEKLFRDANVQEHEGHE